MATATKLHDKTLTVLMPVTFAWRRVQDLLINAFEGGSNYWYCILRFDAPPGPRESWPVLVEDEARKRGDRVTNIYPHGDYPVNPGGSLVVDDSRNDERKATRPARRLDRERLAEALVEWAEKCPRHFANWLAENDDAETADTFLQIAVLGEIIYG